jgi:hypothetical protein
MSDVRSEAEDAFKTLGVMLGVEGTLTPEDITPDIHERMVQKFVKLLRQRGNADLADRYQAAHMRTWQALKNHAHFVALGEGRELTNGERVQADAAEAAADAAAEEFERVVTETSAYLKELDEKAVFTDLSTTVERSESAPGLERTEWGGPWSTSISGAASPHPSCLAPGAVRL